MRVTSSEAADDVMIEPGYQGSSIGERGLSIRPPFVIGLRSGDPSMEEGAHGSAFRILVESALWRFVYVTSRTG